MPSSLPRSAPADQNVDPAAILSFLDAVDARPDVEMHSLMVLRHGTVVAEGWWSPYTRERPHLLYSLSKSFTSTAAGFAVAEGLLDLDDTVLSHFPELDADMTDPRSRSMLVRHVASMASGHDAETWDRAVAASPDEPVRGFLMLPPENDPGTVFAYNQPCTYSLAAIIQRRSGTTLTDYLRPRLFDPLGIGEVGLAAAPGRAGPRLHRVARHHRGRRTSGPALPAGRSVGRRPAAARGLGGGGHPVARVQRRRGPTPTGSQGYGFQFWRSRHGYRGDGAYGQFCVVLPEQDTVVVTTAATEDMQGVLDAVWEHLLPGLGTVHRAPGPRTSSSVRSDRLELPACPGAPAPADWGPWASGPFAITASTAGTQVQPFLTSIEVMPRADGWQISRHRARQCADLSRRRRSLDRL